MPMRPSFWDLVAVLLIGALVCVIVIAALLHGRLTREQRDPYREPLNRPGVSVRIGG